MTEHISDRTIALPFFNHLAEGQIERVCAELRNAVQSLTPAAAIAGHSSLPTIW